MLDDVRNHSALPTDEEQRWLGFDDVGAIARAMVLAAVALGIGWGVSTLLEGHAREVPVIYGTR
jgi:nitroreductase